MSKRGLFCFFSDLWVMKLTLKGYVFNHPIEVFLVRSCQKCLVFSSFKFHPFLCSSVHYTKAICSRAKSFFDRPIEKLAFVTVTISAGFRFCDSNFIFQYEMIRQCQMLTAALWWYFWLCYQTFISLFFYIYEMNERTASVKVRKIWEFAVTQHNTTQHNTTRHDTTQVQMKNLPSVKKDWLYASHYFFNHIFHWVWMHMLWYISVLGAKQFLPPLFHSYIYLIMIMYKAIQGTQKHLLHLLTLLFTVFFSVRFANNESNLFV